MDVIRLKDVVEYMASTDAKFTEFQIWNILRQLSLVPPLRSHSRVESHLVLPQGILHIHEAEIAHLDLKPANIFICANGMLKIGDFGLSTRAGFVHDADSEGDKVYMAPEVLEGCFGKAADIFSLGLVTLELAADVVLPGEGPSWFALRHSDLSEIIFEDISSDLICLIRDMLEPNPSKRPDISHVLQRISRIFQPPHTS